MKIKLEYVWLDGYKPEPNLRSKVKIVESEVPMELKDIPGRKAIYQPQAIYQMKSLKQLIR